MRYAVNVALKDPKNGSRKVRMKLSDPASKRYRFGAGSDSRENLIVQFDCALGSLNEAHLCRVASSITVFRIGFFEGKFLFEGGL